MPNDETNEDGPQPSRIFGIRHLIIPSSLDIRHSSFSTLRLIDQRAG
jgi:hypothetical protein